MDTANVDLNALSERMAAIRAELREEYQQPHTLPWVVAFSAGKDSTLLLQLVVEMVLELPPSQRARRVYVVGNDTLVESPVYAAHFRATMERVAEGVAALRLPVEVVTTKPELEDTFWVSLIGKGYASPTRLFRWCTDRLKIRPTSGYIQRHVAASGKAILLLGVRSAESKARAQSIQRHTPADGARLNPHSSIEGCLVYRPIKDVGTDELWVYLLQCRPPWGGSHRGLITLYRNAQGGECPIVTDKSEAPGCGTTSSRFGCWTCTVVNKDKSAEALVDAGHENLQPLVEFRDWLRALREDWRLRDWQRRNGTTKKMPDGRWVPGPFLVETRQEILARLLEVQRQVGFELISPAEVERCKSLWARDVCARLENTLTLLREVKREAGGVEAKRGRLA